MPSPLVWDQTGERFAEQGVDHGVVYPYNGTTKAYDKGVAWNGLTGVTESPSGAEPTDLWADNMKYLTMRSAEQYGFSIEAFMYPDEFAVCDGTAEAADGVIVHQQQRRTFGFCYRTNVINDTMSEEDDGYKLHLIWGASASPTEKSHTTMNESPSNETFNWTCTTTPVALTTVNPATGKPFKPTAVITINSLAVDSTKLKALEDILYGTTEADASLPSPDRVLAMFMTQKPNG